MTACNCVFLGVVAVLTKRVKEKLIPEGQDLIFILRIDISSSQDDREVNVMHLMIPTDDVAQVLVGPDERIKQHILENAVVEVRRGLNNPLIHLTGC